MLECESVFFGGGGAGGKQPVLITTEASLQTQKKKIEVIKSKCKKHDKLKIYLGGTSTI